MTSNQFRRIALSLPRVVEGVLVGHAAAETIPLKNALTMVWEKRAWKNRGPENTQGRIHQCASDPAKTEPDEVEELDVES